MNAAFFVGGFIVGVVTFFVIAGICASRQDYYRWRSEQLVPPEDDHEI